MPTLFLLHLHAAYETLKPRVRSQAVEFRVDLQKIHELGTLRQRLLKLGEGLILIAQSRENRGEAVGCAMDLPGAR